MKRKIIFALFISMFITAVSIPVSAGGDGEAYESVNPKIEWNKSSDVINGNFYGKISEVMDLTADEPVWENGKYWNAKTGGWVQRIKGTFTIPQGYSTASTFELYSVNTESYKNANSSVTAIKEGKVLPVNDNMYLFVYPSSVTLGADNYTDYLVFGGGTDSWGGINGSHSLGNGVYVDRYKRSSGDIYGTLVDSDIRGAMTSSDGWFLYFSNGNENVIGETISEKVAQLGVSPSSELVIDIFLENTSGDSGGGTDEIMLNITNPNTATVIVRYLKEQEELPFEVLTFPALNAGDSVQIEYDKFRPDGYESGTEPAGKLSGGIYTVQPSDLSSATSGEPVYIDIIYAASVAEAPDTSELPVPVILAAAVLSGYAVMKRTKLKNYKL